MDILEQLADAFLKDADKVGVLNQWYDFELAYAKQKMRDWLENL